MPHGIHKRQIINRSIFRPQKNFIPVIQGYAGLMQAKQPCRPSQRNPSRRLFIAPASPSANINPIIWRTARLLSRAANAERQMAEKRGHAGRGDRSSRRVVGREKWMRPCGTTPRERPRYAGTPGRSSSSEKWQRVKCPGDTCLNSGSVERQISCANGQRGWK